MKVPMRFEFEEDTLRRIRSRVGKAGRATRAEVRLFLEMVVTAACQSLDPPRRRGDGTTGGRRAAQGVQRLSDDFAALLEAHETQRDFISRSGAPVEAQVGDFLCARCRQVEGECLCQPGSTDLMAFDATTSPRGPISETAPDRCAAAHVGNGNSAGEATAGHESAFHDDDRERRLALVCQHRNCLRPLREHSKMGRGCPGVKVFQAFKEPSLAPRAAKPKRRRRAR